MKSIFTSFILLFIFQLGFSQPFNGHYGCRHAKNHIHRGPLTQEEQQLLTESNERSDTIDILNYNITLDITDFGGKTIEGNCEIQFSPKVDNVEEIVLDLLDLDVDSVMLNGDPLIYEYDGNFLTIDFPVPLMSTDTFSFVVYYGGQPTVAAGGFGGMAFENGIAYNLGIGLGENPYNYGRGWFPCFDNFVERSTYDLNIISSGGRKAYCIGTFLSEEPYEEDKIIRSYRMSQLLPTYLVGVAVSNYTTIDYEHTGAYGTHPVQLIAKPEDIADMENSFEFLGDVIDVLELWYGEYVWERVGFVLTPRGAMEHSTNIAFPTNSGIAGPTSGTNRLIAHELAHHWWGNITTLSSPANMWIKEGNAEYGAHLFTEYAFGREAFVAQVKSNLLYVIKNAHVADSGYHPLSGIPFEHTYGVHTYQKGASMLHNMRAYLGDSLFTLAQKAVLEEFPYDAINAEQYRDHLTEVSGVDMSSYFNDWIFSPGFANYELETFESIPNGNTYDINMSIQQKLVANPNMHTNAPLEVTFFGANWEELTQQFVVSGEFTDLSTNIPFEPIFAVLNNNQLLNLARMNSTQVVKEEGSLNAAYTEFLALNAVTVQDSALLNVVHHWTGADEPLNEDMEISNTHYWSVKMLNPDNVTLRATLEFKGNEGQIDYDLLQGSSDDMVLLWRPTIDSEWEVYEDYVRLGNGASGFIQINPLRSGDYALGNDYTVVNNTEPKISGTNIKLMPNPAKDFTNLEVELKNNQSEILINVYTANGQLIQTLNFDATNYLNTPLPTSGLANGLYYVEVKADGKSTTTELIIQR
jgi:aminopeptidase N